MGVGTTRVAPPLRVTVALAVLAAAVAVLQARLAVAVQPQPLPLLLRDLRRVAEEFAAIARGEEPHVLLRVAVDRLEGRGGPVIQGIGDASVAFAVLDADLKILKRMVEQVRHDLSKLPKVLRLFGLSRTMGPRGLWGVRVVR